MNKYVERIYGTYHPKLGNDIGRAWPVVAHLSILQRLQAKLGTIPLPHCPIDSTIHEHEALYIPGHDASLTELAAVAELTGHEHEFNHGAKGGESNKGGKTLC